MNIKWRHNIQDLLDSVELGRLNAAIRLLKLENVVVIDSYEMSPNGPILSSLFVVSDKYLCEIPMGSKHLEFDVAPVGLLCNYRVTFGEHVQQAESSGDGSSSSSGEAGAATAEAKPNTTKFVSVRLSHTESLASKMGYFGADTEAWLQHVLGAYPVSNLM